MLMCMISEQNLSTFYNLRILFEYLTIILYKILPTSILYVLPNTIFDCHYCDVFRNFSWRESN